MSKIYLSSTYMDLVEQREAVYHALRELGHDVVAMEDYVAADERPAEKCLRDVASADVYIGIFAWRYGFVPVTDNPDGLSVTELEYRQARRSGVPCLVFMLRDNAPWLPGLMDSQTRDNDSGRRVSLLREELAGERLCGDFGSAEELARKVAAAVQLHLAGRDAEPPPTLDPELPWRRFVAHMRTYAGAMSDRQADVRYVELALQQERHDERGYSQVRVGPLNTLVAYPENYVLFGPHGSGKTTLLLREAHRLAARGIGLPAYVSLAGFGGGDGDTVLELAAEQNRLHGRPLFRSWRQGGDRVCLLVDDVDDQQGELPAVAAALGDLHRTKATDNNIVVAAPSHAAADCLASALPVQRLLVLPLSLDAITAFLDGYGRDDLRDAVRSWSGAGPPLLTMLSQPDLLAAWAQAPRDSKIDRPSLARILRTQLRRLLAGAGQTFDHDRVLTPALGLLAYCMLSSSQPALAMDDDLLEKLSDLLDDIYQRYHRRRNVMPDDWSAEMLVRTAAQSPVVDLGRQSDGEGYVTFSRARFADWYAAWYVGQLARTGAGVTSAIAKLADAGAEGALTQLVDADAAGAKYADAIAAVDRQMAERVWLIGSGRRQAPSSLQEQFDRLASDQYEEWAARDRHHDLNSLVGTADPRRKLQVVDPRLSPETLLDLAEDTHPFVRGAAEYVLLHSAEDGPMSPLSFEEEQRELAFRCHGAGQATIAGMRLLSVPADSVIRLRVSVGRLETDPFDSPDNILRFLPLPAAAVAAELLSDSEGQDWLLSAATLYVAARLSHEHAMLAAQRSQLADLAQRLSHRTVDLAGLAATIGEDLGLRLRDLPPVPDAAIGAAADAYNRLRHSFDPQARKSAIKEPSGNLDVRTAIGDISGSNVVSVDADNMTVESRYADGYYVDDLAHINLRTSADRIESGSVRSLVVDTLHGSAAPLPIRLQVKARLSANILVNGCVGGVIVNRIANAYPNWEVNCRISIDRILGSSSLLGVIVGGDAEAASR